MKPKQLALALTLLLAGCGDSVSERHDNQRRDEKIRGVEMDAELRIQALEDRVSVLERAGKP